MKKKTSSIFMATNPLRVLSFFAASPEREFLGSEIQKSLKLSRMGVYLALRVLAKEKLIRRLKKGKFLTYVVDRSHPVVKQYKILRHVLEIYPLAERLMFFSKKIVLYGSVSRGEDAPDSDIDLFILTADPEAAAKKVPVQWLGQKIQTVIKTPSDWIELKDKDPVFYEEVNRGVILWEAQE